MKKKILVDLPDNLIDTETKKTIKTLKAENSKLRSQNSLLISQALADKYKVEKAERLIEAIRVAGDFCPDECHGDRA